MKPARLPRRAILACAVLVLSAAAAARADTWVVRFVVNGEPKGDIFAERTPAGDFMVRAADLAAAGIREPKGTIVELAGEPYVALRSMTDVASEFDEKTLTLSVAAAPAILPVRAIDFAQKRQPRVERPTDTSGFLNYRVGYTADDGSRSWNAENQLGARYGGVLFLTDSTYTKTSSESSFVRLQTNATWDRRESMDRAVLGDVVASSGDLGAAVNLGGASWSRVYRIDPYFRTHPLAALSGLVAMPSDAQVYLNGMLLRTERLAPGGFELTNLDYYGGASRVTVVLRDPFGREQRFAAPFYFTDALLRKGLQEYSYNAGFLREDFGVRSNRYGAFAFSAVHNYGASDSVTAGLRAEGGGGMANAGPRVTVGLGQAGVVTTAVSGSYDEDRGGGAAGLVGYSWQDNTAGVRLFAKGYSRGYAVLADVAAPDRPRYEAGAGAGYGARRAGSFTLDFGAAGTHAGATRRSVVATYSRRLADRTTLFASYRKTRDVESVEEVFVGLTHSLSRDVTLSGSVAGGDGRTRETVQAQKYVPAGEGYGFRAQAERTDGGGESGTAFNPFLQYNGQRAVLTGEYRGRFPDRGGSRQSYQLTASGGIAAVGGVLGLSRPVTDSFGVVSVDNVEGVRVMVSNQVMGRTDARGRVFVPALSSYYENPVSIEDKDIPIEYAVDEVVKHVSPPLRSGSVIRFGARKFQAVAGSLSVRDGEAVRPAEYVEVRMSVAGRDVVFPTGRRGEFYLENVAPGSYRAAFDSGGKTCEFDLAVPAAGDLVLELGGIVCEIPR